MNKLDRRFINVSLIVEGVAAEPPASPAEGVQYIVGATPTANTAFVGYANAIAKYNGTNWVFTAPEVGDLEVFNREAGAIQKWNGSAWVSVLLLGNEVFLVEGTAAEPPASPTEGVQYIVSAPPTSNTAFAGHGNTIATYNGGNWSFADPADSIKVFNKSEGTVLKWNGTAWVTAMQLGGSMMMITGILTYSDGTQPSNPYKGDTYIDSTSGKWLRYDGTAWQEVGIPETPGNGDMFFVINYNNRGFYSYDSSTKTLIFVGTINLGQTFFNLSDNKMYVFIYNMYKNSFAIAPVNSGHICETFTITSNEITRKYINLVSGFAGEGTCYSSNYMVFLNGILQINDVDVVWDGSSLYWDSLGLDSKLQVGDTLTVYYEPQSI